MTIQHANHQDCVDTLEAAARARCDGLALRPTQQRLKILRALATQHRAMGAYEILAQINRNSSTKAAATAIYRALEFWQKVGLVHKIGGLDRYCVCFNAHDNHRHMVVCCDRCYTVQELCDHRAGFDLSQALVPLGFAKDSAIQIEVIARCHDCVDTSTPSTHCGSQS